MDSNGFFCLHQSVNQGGDQELENLVTKLAILKDLLSSIEKKVRTDGTFNSCDGQHGGYCFHFVSHQEKMWYSSRVCHGSESSDRCFCNL